MGAESGHNCPTEREQDDSNQNDDDDSEKHSAERGAAAAGSLCARSASPSSTRSLGGGSSSVQSLSQGGGAPALQVARSGILKGHVLARWPRPIGPTGLNLVGGRLVSVIQRNPTSSNCGGEFS